MIVRGVRSLESELLLRRAGAQTEQHAAQHCNARQHEIAKHARYPQAVRKNTGKDQHHVEGAVAGKKRVSTDNKGEATFFQHSTVCLQHTGSVGLKEEQ